MPARRAHGRIRVRISNHRNHPEVSSFEYTAYRPGRSGGRPAGVGRPAVLFPVRDLQAHHHDPAPHVFRGAVRRRGKCAGKRPRGLRGEPCFGVRLVHHDGDHEAEDPLHDAHGVLPHEVLGAALPPDGRDRGARPRPEEDACVHAEDEAAAPGRRADLHVPRGRRVRQRPDPALQEGAFADSSRRPRRSGHSGPHRHALGQYVPVLQGPVPLHHAAPVPDPGGRGDRQTHQPGHHAVPAPPAHLRDGRGRGERGVPERTHHPLRFRASGAPPSVPLHVQGRGQTGAEGPGHAHQGADLLARDPAAGREERQQIHRRAPAELRERRHRALRRAVRRPHPGDPELLRGRGGAPGVHQESGHQAHPHEPEIPRQAETQADAGDVPAGADRPDAAVQRGRASSTLPSSTPSCFPRAS